MECRIVRFGERDRVADLHPELCAFDAGLAKPPFPANPVASDPDFPFLFYCIKDGEILGSRRAIPDIVRRGERSYPLAWCYDMIVAPSARGKGIGTKLVSVQVDEFERRGTIGAAAFTAAPVMRIYEKLDYSVLGFVPRYVLVRDAARFLEPKLKSAALSRLTAIPANLILSANFSSKGARDMAGLHLGQIDLAEWAALWSELPDPSDVYHWDGSADWSLSRIQDSDRCYAVHSGDDGGLLLALLVVRDRKPASGGGEGFTTRQTLVHYKYDRSDAGADALGKALATLLYRDKPAAADIVTSDPRLQARLSALGYARRDEGMTFVFKVPSGMVLEDAGGQEDWNLTHFCSDGFLFP